MSDLTRPASEAANVAHEAEAEAMGRRPKAEGHEAEATTTLLAKNPKAAAILARAEAARIKAEAMAASQNAEAARLAEAELASANRAVAKAEAKELRKAKAAQRRAEGRAKVASKAGGLLNKIRSEAAASWSAFVYAVVVSVAVWSQHDVFRTQFLWGNVPAWGAAIFIELTGLAFYATSVSMRLDGRSGLVPRAIAWVVTAFAAFMQYQAHHDVQVNGVPLLSYALGAASILALALAEIRTSHQVGKKLEAMDQKDRPQARLGLRFCIRYPGKAFWAISAMIALPSVRTRSQALRAGRAIQHRRARRDLALALMDEAEKLAKAARKAGTPEAALMRLEEWATYGLEAIGLQTELASAPAVVEAEPLKAEATIERPSTERPTFNRPKPKAVPPASAQGRPKEIEAKAEASEAKAGDEATGLYAEWADRPGNNPFAWEQRIAELAAQFPGDADAVPSRQFCIDTLKERKAGGEELRFAWTNKGHVGFALNDLKSLRAAGIPDPKIQAETNTPDNA